MPLVLVIGELSDGAPAAVTDQLLAAARNVGDEGEIRIAFLGDSVSGVDDISASQVHILEHPRLGDLDAGVFDAAVAAVESLCSEVNPVAVLFAKTDFGAVAGPRLAFRLGTAAAQDCTDLGTTESGKIAVTRPVHGGNAQAVYEFDGDGPHVIIIRPGAFEAGDLPPGSPEIITTDLEGRLPDQMARLIDSVSEQRTGVRLEEADVVVSGGRGLGGPEPFKHLEELAAVLGGAVGASRAACDAGWIDHNHQVGLTGKSISPNLYITVGISGASQHMAGCSSSRNIVAINKDGDANIFKEARFGVVGDWEQVLPAFIATVRDLSG